MSSAKSGINQVELYTGNSTQIQRGKGSKGKKFYYTEVTPLGKNRDEGIIAETYRTDAQGLNPVLVRKSIKKVGEEPIVTYGSASEDEKRNFLVGKSSLSREIVNQTNEAYNIVKNNISQISKNNAEIAGGGSGNTSSDTGETSPKPIENKSFQLDSFEIKANNRRKNYENLFYPEDIQDTSQDKIRFKMFYQYGRDLKFDLNEKDGNIFSLGKRKKGETILGSVTLPIQGGISDFNEVDYNNNATMSPVIGALSSIALDPFGALSQLGNVFDLSADQLREKLNTTASNNIINALRIYLAQSATNTQGLIPRTTGAILNPNLELLLNAPKLRSFKFSFKMSARSSTEATQIRKIIRFFKQGMTVKKSPTSLFLVSPNMFNIQYLTDGGMQHPSIGRIKECALASINTQYTPDGTYMTFDDEKRTMTSYQIDMTFIELEPLTETDYLNADHDVAGTSNFLLAPELDDFVTDSSIGY